MSLFTIACQLWVNRNGVATTRELVSKKRWRADGSANTCSVILPLALFVRRAGDAASVDWWQESPRPASGVRSEARACTRKRRLRYSAQPGFDPFRPRRG